MVSGSSPGFIQAYFEQPSVCGDLPTLALTGGTIATGSLGLAATMFFAGGLLMFARRRPVTQP